jgi:hypothetical protein
MNNLVIWWLSLTTLGVLASSRDDEDELDASHLQSGGYVPGPMSMQGHSLMISQDAKGPNVITKSQGANQFVKASHFASVDGSHIDEDMFMEALDIDRLDEDVYRKTRVIDVLNAYRTILLSLGIEVAEASSRVIFISALAELSERIAGHLWYVDNNMGYCLDMLKTTFEALNELVNPDEGRL